MTFFKSIKNFFYASQTNTLFFSICILVRRFNANYENEVKNQIFSLKFILFNIFWLFFSKKFKIENKSILYTKKKFIET